MTLNAPQHRIKSAPRKVSAILVLVLVGLLAAVFLLHNRKPHPAVENVRAPAVSQKTPVAPAKTGIQGAPNVDPGLASGAGQETVKVTAVTDPSVFSAFPPKAAKENDSCAPVRAELHRFFTHLDQQDYVVAGKLEGGSLAHFNRLLAKLFANPPIMSRETDDLLFILQNMTHFFRVLGKKDLLLLKDVLGREQKNIEPIMALFYQWSLNQERCAAETRLPRLPLSSLYSYAGFFLNTLGGQAYLSRRGWDFRVLFRYYAVLILDRANEAKLNVSGLDIRYPLSGLITEMEAYQDLQYRDEYLEKLLELKEKYQAP